MRLSILITCLYTIYIHYKPVSVYLKENLMLFPAVILRIPRRAVRSKDFLFIWKYITANFFIRDWLLYLVETMQLEHSQIWNICFFTSIQEKITISHRSRPSAVRSLTVCTSYYCTTRECNYTHLVIYIV
jgi:hypothetical protein